MFTGIIHHRGTLLNKKQHPEGAVITIVSPAFAAPSGQSAPLRVGDSISVSGVCLTAVALREAQQEAEFDIASETLRCTTLGDLAVGSSCHLERSLRLGDSLDGHLVFGHVDGTAALVSKKREGETTRLEFRMPEGLAAFIAPKGSITLDGVSLTVGEVGRETFSVYIIPHTFEVTRFGTLECGQSVNVEIDMIARYVARVLEVRGTLPL